MSEHPPSVDRIAHARKIHARLFAASTTLFVGLVVWTTARALADRPSELPLPTSLAAFVVIAGILLPLTACVLLAFARRRLPRPEATAEERAMNVVRRGAFGIGVLLIAHDVLHFYLAVRAPAVSSVADMLHAELASATSAGPFPPVPWLALGYVVGFAGVAIAFFTALTDLATSSSPRANAMRTLSSALVFVIGTGSVLFFATGLRFGVRVYADRYEATHAAKCPDR